MLFPNRRSRRQILQGSAACGATLLWAPGVFAEELMRTPALTEGPFYPDHLPLDRDNDLIIVNDNTTPAIGEVTHLSGRILTPNGSPVRNALIEIWQCDANAVYLHSADSGKKKDQQDKNFQGYGKFETNAKGEYRFRTIKPVPYPGRPAPHIHFKITRGDRPMLTSQLMIRGHEGNMKDGIFRNAGDMVDRELIQADFVPVKDSKIGELACKFDIVVGRTPDDEQFTPAG